MGGAGVGGRSSERRGRGRKLRGWHERLHRDNSRRFSTPGTRVQSSFTPETAGDKTRFVTASVRRDDFPARTSTAGSSGAYATRLVVLFLIPDFRPPTSVPQFARLATYPPACSVIRALRKLFRPRNRRGISDETLSTVCAAVCRLVRVCGPRVGRGKRRPRGSRQGDREKTVVGIARRPFRGAHALRIGDEKGPQPRQHPIRQRSLYQHLAPTRYTVLYHRDLQAQERDGSALEAMLRRTDAEGSRKSRHSRQKIRSGPIG